MHRRKHFGGGNIFDAAHIMDDAMLAAHWVPPLRPVAASEQCQAGNANSCREMHRATVVPEKEHRIFHGSCAFTWCESTAEVKALTDPFLGKPPRSLEFVRR